VPKSGSGLGNRGTHLHPHAHNKSPGGLIGGLFRPFNSAGTGAGASTEPVSVAKRALSLDKKSSSEESHRLLTEVPQAPETVIIGSVSLRGSSSRGLATSEPPDSGVIVIAGQP
jgi:hypothetical protein